MNLNILYRRKILEEEFGFTCQCDLCSLTDPSINLDQNDAKRKELLEIEQNWTKLGHNPTEALNLAKNQLELAKDLDLHGGLLAYLSLHCVEACSLIISSKDTLEDIDIQDIHRQGLEYAQLANEYGVIAYGGSSGEAQVFSDIASLWTDLPMEDLFKAMQDSIARLRDIAWKPKYL